MIDDDTLARLESEHGGKIRLFQDSSNDPPEWQIVLRKPTGKEAMNFRFTANAESRKVFAAIDVVKATMVWPAKEEWPAMLEANPFLPEGITSDLSWKQWVGLEVAATQKK